MRLLQKIAITIVFVIGFIVWGSLLGELKAEARQALSEGFPKQKLKIEKVKNIEGYRYCILPEINKASFTNKESLWKELVYKNAHDLRFTETSFGKHLKSVMGWCGVEIEVLTPEISVYDFVGTEYNLIAVHNSENSRAHLFYIPNRLVDPPEVN